MLSLIASLQMKKERVQPSVLYQSGHRNKLRLLKRLRFPAHLALRFFWRYSSGFQHGRIPIYRNLSKPDSTPQRHTLHALGTEITWSSPEDFYHQLASLILSRRDVQAIIMYILPKVLMVNLQWSTFAGKLGIPPPPNLNDITCARFANCFGLSIDDFNLLVTIANRYVQKNGAMIKISRLIPKFCRVASLLLQMRMLEKTEYVMVAGAPYLLTEGLESFIGFKNVQGKTNMCVTNLMNKVLHLLNYNITNGWGDKVFRSAILLGEREYSWEVDLLGMYWREWYIENNPD